MAKQVINLGTAPTGVGGDTFRSTGTKSNNNFDELYSFLGGDTLQKGLPVGKAVRLMGAINSEKSFNTNSELINDARLSKLSHASSAQVNGSWVNYLWLAHRGGEEDGESYGLMLADRGMSMVQSANFYIQKIAGNPENLREFLILTSGNTSTDSNGFIKVASPIAKLFSEKIELNEEALEQEPVFEKVDIGHYLLKNTEGFSDDGWYIEMPKDANGNVLVAVQYQQLEDNTIEVKTFAKKFDEETGDIVPNLDKPRDIPAGRWIDIRLKALPQPEIEISNTPADFQPTNLAQAVAEALKNDAEQ